MSTIDKQQIRDILTAIARVSRGDYQTRLEPTGTHSDLDSIISGMNMMINEIRSRQEDLEEQREEINSLNKDLIREIDEREQAEILYKTLTEHSPTGVYITQHGKFVFFNEVFCRYAGYSGEELLEMNSIDLVIPEDRENARQAAVDMLKGIRTHGYEFRIRRKNGEILWAEENITSIEYKGERAAMGNFSDITERKNAEESLHFSDLILKSIHDGIIALDTDLKVTFWNSASADMFGIKTEDAIGSFIGDLLQMKEEYSGQNLQRHEVLDKAGFNKEEQLYITPKGEVWIDATSQEIIKDGVRQGWVTLASDITGRKIMETMIKENEERYSTVFHSNPMPMMIFSPETGIVVDVNIAFERENHFPRSEIVGKTVQDHDMFVYPEQNLEMRKIMQEQGRVENFEAQIRNGNGEYRTHLLSSGMITIGGEQYLVTASNDITRQKEIEKRIQETNEQLDSQNFKLKAQAQLLIEQREELLEKNREIETANQMKSEFLASMSHELRTPLNAVIGFSELMLDGVTGDINDEQKDCLNDILGSGNHLLELINDVLDLSKVEVGKMQFNPVELGVSEVITESVQTVRSLLDQKEHTISIDVEEGIGTIYADKSRLRQVLLNLLSNAIKFTPQKGNIRITAETDDTMCKFGVTDNGIGIKAEDQEKIFDVFTQAETIQDETPKGTGLGLTLTRQFLMAMGGTIWVESEYGKGSKFYFTIPFVGKGDPGAVTEKEQPTVIDTQALMVLVVDDDPKARRLTSSLLKDEGFSIVEAANAYQGLELAGELLPDLIILDILMPDKDGWYVLRELKADPKTHDIPVIIASVGEERDIAFSLGAVDYFNKPINRDRFRRRIAELDLGKHDMVLVVDDNPADIRLVSSILESEGIPVVKATGGKSAIEIMLREKPSLIVLDIVMPDLTGFEVIEKLSENPDMANIPIIVITSKDLSVDELDFIREKTKGVVAKSAFRREDFVGEVKKIIRAGKPG